MPMVPEWLRLTGPDQDINQVPLYPTGELTGGEQWLREALNKPLLNELPFEQEMQRFNPTLGQGVRFGQEFLPGIGDASAIAEAQNPEMPIWMKMLNYASVVPGLGDIARLGGNTLPLFGAMTAFHGSPHKFDKFDITKIGTGEGAQAYGHGLYFAESPGVANSYRLNLTQGKTIEFSDGVSVDLYELSKQKTPEGLAASHMLQDARFAPKGKMREVEELSPDLFVGGQKEKDDVLKGLQSFIDRKAKQIRGSLYEVDIPDSAIERMLDWDKPLSEQPESVIAGLKKSGIDLPSEEIIKKAQNDVNSAWDKYQSARKQYGYKDARTVDAEAAWQEARDVKEGLEQPWRMKGEEVYRRLATEELKNKGGFAIMGRSGEPEKAVSERLNSLGIPGIKYLDQGSRASGEGTRNFVVFDDKTVKILSRNGEKVAEANKLPEKSFYIPIGNGVKVEVIKNPTPQDYQDIAKEVKKEFPSMLPGEPKTRFTYDSDGNRYIWKAHQAVHASIEPELSKILGKKVNQNLD